MFAKNYFNFLFAPPQKKKIERKKKYCKTKQTPIMKI